MARQWNGAFKPPNVQFKFNVQCSIQVLSRLMCNLPVTPTHSKTKTKRGQNQNDHWLKWRCIISSLLSCDALIIRRRRSELAIHLEPPSGNLDLGLRSPQLSFRPLPLLLHLPHFSRAEHHATTVQTLCSTLPLASNHSLHTIGLTYTFGEP